MKKRLPLILAATIGAVSLAGCSGGGGTGSETTTASGGSGTTTAASQTASGDKILRIAGGFDFKSCAEARYLVFDSLLQSDMWGQITPNLAESYDVSDDGLTYTFHLKKGVKYHDGTPFNADTAKFSLEYYQKNNSPGEDIESITAVDENTVEMKLKKYNDLILYDIATPTNWGGVPMILEKDVDSEGKITGYIGTGAFIFDDSTYESGVKATMKKNPDYWGGAPKVDGVEWDVVSDPNAMVVALESDQVDAIGIAEHHSSVPYVQVSSLKSKGYNVETDETGRYQVLEYNCTKAPFDDKNVRMAFNLAVDKELMVDTLFEGLTEAANVITSPDFKYGPKKVDKDYYKYDKDKAEKLLDDAGWKDSDGDGVREKDGKKLEVKLIVPNGEANADAVAVYVQSELAKIGATVDVQNLESSAASDASKKGEYDMYVHHSGCMPGVPGGINPGGKYHSSSSWTYSFHSDELDKMIESAFAESNEDSRQQQVAAIWQYLHEEAPCMPLYSVKKLSAMNPRLSGYHVGQNMFDMSMIKDMDMDTSK